MATNSLVEDQQSGLLLRLTQQEKQLGVQAQQAEDAFDALTEDKLAAAEHQAELDTKISDAEELLSSLKAAERARLRRIQQAERARLLRIQQAEQARLRRIEAAEAEAPQFEPPEFEQPEIQAPEVEAPEVEQQQPQPTRSAPRPPVTSVPGSSRAATAVRTALAQVGDAYVYGAAGPNAFDCSGLTMYAWRAAGVSIPHASSMQPGAGTADRHGRPYRLTTLNRATPPARPCGRGGFVSSA